MAIYIIEVLETVSKTYCINVPDDVNDEEAIQEIFENMNYQEQAMAFVEEESVDCHVNSVVKSEED